MNNSQRVTVKPIIVKEDINSCRKVSRRILSSDGNLMKLSFAALICIVALMFPIVLGNAALYFSGAALAGDDMSAMALGGFSFLTLLFGAFVCFTLPVIYGMYGFARKTVGGEKPSVKELFSPFSEAYGRSIFAGAVTLARILFTTLPIVGGIALIPTVWDMLGGDSSFLSVCAVCLVILATVAAECAVLFAQSYLFFFNALVLRGVAPRKAFAISVRMSRGRRVKITEYMMGFFWHVVASVLSFGLLFVIYTVPLMTVSYFVYTDKFFCE